MYTWSFKSIRSILLQKMAIFQMQYSGNVSNHLKHVCSVKSRIQKGHTFLGPKRALFVAKLDFKGT